MTTLRYFPHVFFLPKNDRQWEVTAWCEQEFGKCWSPVGNRTGVWCCFWAGREMRGHYEWCFQKEQDATVFLLRWS